MNSEPNIFDSVTEDDIPGLAILEKLFFAYRDFISDPDKMLDRIGFGRAHHRVLYFVNRKPGLTVAELLDTLRITKQSLARVLKQLIDTGYVAQIEGEADRRKRLLFPTSKGRALILELSAPQSDRIAKALENLNENERIAVAEFLKKMADSQTGP